MNLSSADVVSSIRGGSPVTAPIGWLLLAVTGAWAHGQTVLQLVQHWMREPDYSHGLLAPVIAAVILYVRRDVMPPSFCVWSLYGALLICAAAMIQVGAALFYFEFGRGWSLVVWILGSAVLAAGAHVTRWIWPAMAFLALSLPLPYSVEHYLARPLQRLSAQSSAYLLQTCGQPAFAEGNVIVVGERLYEVERACAGMRIFIGVLALAVACTALSKRGVIECCLLLAAAIPVALAANVARIVFTALALQHGPANGHTWFYHDLAGWLMTPFAAAMLLALHWYLGCLFDYRGPTTTVPDVLRRQRSTPVRRPCRDR